MNLEFSEVNFSNIGRETTKPDAMWGNLELRFLDSETIRFCGVEFSVFLPRRPDVTISELQKVARDRALEILQEALSCLEANDIAQLEKLSETTKKKHLDDMLSKRN